jgi:hypothetical protein
VIRDAGASKRCRLALQIDGCDNRSGCLSLISPLRPSASARLLRGASQWATQWRLSAMSSAISDGRLPLLDDGTPYPVVRRSDGKGEPNKPTTHSINLVDQAPIHRDKALVDLQARRKECG